jgi:hypothetical protein
MSVCHGKNAKVYTGGCLMSTEPRKTLQGQAFLKAFTAVKKHYNLNMIICVLLLVFIFFVKGQGRGLGGLFMPSSIFLILDYIFQLVLPIIIISTPSQKSNEALFIELCGFIGFFIAYFGMRFGLFFKISRFKSLFSHKINHSTAAKIPGLVLIFHYLVIIGIFLVFFVFYRFAVIPLLDENPNQARFFFYDPDYFGVYKYLYWIGLLLIIQASLLIFILQGIKNVRSAVIIFLGAVTLLLTAHRAPILGLAFSITTYYYQINHQQASLGKIFSLVSLALFLMFVFLFYREGSGEMLYWLISAFSNGNTFVDFHELGIALELWDGKYLYGITYLGTLTSIVPDICPGCSIPRWKDWTKILFNVGLESGGYRLTPFGEPFFNFGIFGVIFKGVCCGVFFFYFDDLVKKLTILKENYRLKFDYLLFTSFSIIVVNFYDLRFFVIQFLIAFTVVLYTRMKSL